MGCYPMSKSSSLPYSAPFRYTKPALDLQAMLGAQTGNPPILPVEDEPAPAAKKRPSAGRKAVKPAAKPAAPAKAKASPKPAFKAPAAKAKKPAAKR